MKKLNELNFYEILGVDPSATSKEIKEAYESSLETYRVDSLAIYSLLDDEERKAMKDKIEKAYETLISPDSRKEYNRKLMQSGELSPDQTLPAQSSKIETADKREESKKESVSGSEEEPEYELTTYDGPDLKAYREHLGIELETISKKTKIGKRQLENIEANNLSQLPAMIYLKGFLRSYARCLGLDPDKVAEKYIIATSAQSGNLNK